MKKWFSGRECDVKSANDVTEAVRTLARLHICLNVVSAKGVKYVCDNGSQNINKQWECMALSELEGEKPEAELKASESCVRNVVLCGFGRQILDRNDCPHRRRTYIR